MKEFEKWLKDKAGIGWYTGAEEGWRAALKMVLTYKKHIKYKDYEFDWVKTDVIEQELQDD